MPSEPPSPLFSFLQPLLLFQLPAGEADDGVLALQLPTSCTYRFGAVLTGTSVIVQLVWSRCRRTRSFSFANSSYSQGSALGL
ncbi:hypothetical protein F5144DRAFT_582340 [Chaetomium tenue]|uniref:Uncharacterized protein n=1 Tax=Chaetomium tenue TaxID=1854479 RepID=A0ACB7NZJ6_9PEZI|nr:hypothetical protein F5144DRAFT_582340 [Chaetomium globosum]